MRQVITVGVVCLLMVPAPLLAEPPPPYDLEIVLRTGSHRLLAPAFRAELRAQLLDSLSAAFGPLARVRVIDLQTVPADEWKPLWREVEAKGLAHLDRETRLGTSKTHFVQVQFIDGHYEIAARQHDGWTGLASPIVRQARSAERSMVARLACLLIGRDFGLNGTLGRLEGDQVTVTLRGGGLGVPLSAWVKKGEVFALSRPAIRGREPRGSRIEAALLQALDPPTDQGTIRCRLMARYRQPLDRNATYRCVKLGTTEGPLKLKLVDERGLPHSNLTVRASSQGFDSIHPERELVPLRNDVFDSGERRFAHLVCVRIYAGGGGVQLARLPIEMIDDREIVLSIDVNEGAELRSDLEVRKRALRSRLDESLMVLADRFRDAVNLIKNDLPSLEQARARATAGKDEIARLLAPALEQRDALLADAAKLPKGSAAFSLSDCENRIQAVKNYEQKFAELAEKLERTIAAEKDPAKIAQKQKWERDIVRASALWQQADYDQALELYRQVLSESQSPPLKAQVEKLANAWAIRDPAHQDARTFVLSEWPKLNQFEAIEKALPKARKAIDEFRRVDDKLTPVKFLRGVPRLSELLNEELKNLDKDDDEDLAVIKRIKRALDRIEALAKEALTLTGAKSEVSSQ